MGSFQRASSLFPAVSAGLMRENDFVWLALKNKKSVTPAESCHVASLWNGDLECCLLLSPGKSAEIWLMTSGNYLSSHPLWVQVLVAAARSVVHRLCPWFSFALQSWGGFTHIHTHTPTHPIAAGAGLRDSRATGAAGTSRSASPQGSRQC